MKEINIENSFVALENALNISITIIDNAGAFHTSQGLTVFSPKRQSHKKNSVCNIGFSDKKCRGHCRYELNEKCAKTQKPFVETCWKGVSEIVVPLWHDGIHYGMLYAGSWRHAESLPPSGLPKTFYSAYDKLPLMPPAEKIDAFKSILTVFAIGLLSFLKELNAFESVPNTRGNQMMEFIQNHAVEKITLADIAAHLNLSCSRTSYLLRNVLNKSFPELLQEERLRRVKTLLASSKMSLNAIAVQTGFTDEYYLAKVFKQHNNQTPGQYRKNCNKISQSARRCK